MKRHARAIGFGVAGVLALGACANILGIDDLTNGVPPPVDAGPDTYRDPCTSAPGPLKPTTADEASQAPLSFALDSIDFGSEFDPPGVNLDLKCTFALDAGSCVPLSGKVPTGQIDGDGGIDNSSVGVIANNAFPTNIASEVKAALGKRVWTLLLRVDDYSGKDDDPNVTVHAIAGFDVPALGGGAASGTWSIDGAFTDAGISGGPVSSSAWVAGGVLRAQFADLTFIARSVVMGTFMMRLRGAYVIGKLTSDRKALTGGVVAGRWNVDDVTEEIKRLKLPLGAGCAGKLITDSVCRAKDIKSDPKDDSKGFECDAVSVGFRFTAAASTFAPDGVDGGGLSDQSCASDTTICQ